MFKMKLKVYAVAFALVMGMAGGALASSIVIDGSTTSLPFAQLGVERFMGAHPEVRISLSGGGSGNGIRALIDKTANIANSSRAIRQSEIEQAEANGVNVHETVVAVDCLAVIVHPSNTVPNLTFEQLKQIYTGEVTNWREVGGPDSAIAVVQRDSSSGTFGTWQEMVVDRGGEARVTPRAQTVASSGAVLSTVAGNRFAIGYDGLGYVDETVRAVSVEGVTPSIETAMDGSYPLSRNLYMYTDNEPAGMIKAFIDYMLSPDGQRIVLETGFVPVQ